MQILTQGGGFFAAENGVNSNTYYGLWRIL